MEKTLYAGSIMMCLTLVVGSVVWPGSILMWLASTSTIMNVARLVLIALIIGLLLIRPPMRRLPNQLLIGLAVLLTGWAVARSLSGTVEVMDSAVFLQAGILCLLTALRPAPLPVVVPIRIVTDAADMSPAKTPLWPSLPLPLRHLVTNTALATLVNSGNSRSVQGRWPRTNPALRKLVLAGPPP